MISLYKDYFPLLFCCLLMAVATHSTAQNTPDLNQTAPAGMATVTNDLPPVTVPNGKLNYVRTFIPRLPMTGASSINTTTPDVYTSTTYKDGFSREMQTITKDFAQGGKHLVMPADSRFQRDYYSFLPYSVTGTATFKPDALVEQRSFYLNNYPGEGGASYNLSRKYSDAVDRMTQNFAAGKSQVGQGRGITVRQVTNAANEVRIWKLDAGGLPVSNGFYGAGELFGEKMTTSDGAQVLVYKDKDGKVIYQNTYQDEVVNQGAALSIYGTTYYIYDALGQLRYVAPPKASSLISGGTISTTILNNLCFRYLYDARGLMVERQVPGKEVEYYVYDKRKRLALYQDGNLRNNENWLFTAYDALDRPLFSGLYYTTNESQSVLQAFFYDNINYQPIYLIHYLKNYEMMNTYLSAPVVNTTVLQETYYDDYTISDPANTVWDTYSSELQFTEILGLPGAETPNRSNCTEGMVTGSRVKILPSPNADPSTTGDWRETVTYYDDKGRVIYTVAKDLYQGNPIHVHYSGSQYNFSDNLLMSKHVVVNALSTDGMYRHTELNRNVYDNLRNRLTQTRHKVDGGAWNITSIYTYDDLGRPQRKVLGNYGEVRDYDYNIRGQLTGINRIYAETGDRQGESRSFGESLKYDYGFTQPKYDGKIAGMIWRGGGNSLAMAYGYSYDKEGRLKAADYRRYEPPSSGYLSYAWRKDLSDYSVSNLTYDRNGNLETMKQRGLNLLAQPDDIDRLRYNYESISNKLLYVSDTVTADNGRGDFLDGNTGSNDYQYDDNGNLLLDKNKNIIGISYNHFNKPSRIAFANGGYIEYSYDAAGNKVQEQIYNHTDHSTKVTDYVGNFTYKNNELQYTHTAEGRSVYNKDNQSFREEYFVKDHLGNVRSVIDVYTYPTAEYLATYEVASANLENLFFEKIDEVRDDKPGSTWNGDLKSARLNGADPSRTTGTSALLKVMAGDKVEMTVNNFYEDYSQDIDDNPLGPEALLNSIFSTLTGGVGGMPGEAHDTKIAERAFTLDNYGLFDQIVQGNTDPDKPKAYLNYILFDENMRIVENASGSFQANGDGTWTQIGTTTPLVMPANGYLAVYLNNGSRSSTCLTCTDVFFDQLVLRFTRGNLKEEAHYYPHGLPIANIGGAAEGFVENRRKYQSNEYIKDLGLNWMDFNARQYDPQLGRFLSIDPLADAEGQQVWSPYAAMGNAPESMIDPNGDIASTSFNSPEEAFQFFTQMNMMFGADNWSLSASGEIIFTNEYAARYAFERFLASGEGGGPLAVGETMDFIGSQILASHNSAVNNIKVGVAGNHLEILNDGGVLAEPEIAAKAMTYNEQRWSKLTNKRQISNFDGFWGQLYHFKTGGNIGGLTYNDEGIPYGLSPIGGTAPTDIGFSGVKITKLLDLLKAIKAAKGANSSAHLATNSVNLAKQLASEAQMAEKGITIIGPGKLSAGERLAQEYGGNAVDWVKKSSSSFSKNGVTFETHWYENTSTGARVEFKTKFP